MAPDLELRARSSRSSCKTRGLGFFEKLGSVLHADLSTKLRHGLPAASPLLGETVTRGSSGDWVNGGRTHHRCVR